MICPKCGLPKAACVCEVIAREEQRIRVKLEKKRYGKFVTVIGGMDAKQVNLKDIAKRLKHELACGGTVKEGFIELQGNHLNDVKDKLIRMGFSADMIEI